MKLFHRGNVGCNIITGSSEPKAFSVFKGGVVHRSVCRIGKWGLFPWNVCSFSLAEQYFYDFSTKNDLQYLHFLAQKVIQMPFTCDFRSIYQYVKRPPCLYVCSTCPALSTTPTEGNRKAFRLWQKSKTNCFLLCAGRSIV